MDPSPKILGPDAVPRSFSLSNGALKRHHHLPLPPAAVAVADLLYRECLKNHAASLGGYALDGCGEFMLSPMATPADPTSLKCAACGCHRNFHRRLPEPLLLHHPDDGGGGGQEGGDEMDGGYDEDDDGRHRDEEEDGEAEGRRRGRGSASPPPYSSAPHMLLALSSGLPGSPSPGRVVGPPATALPRKRFRTKFSPEQKERMHELSERLGWRMQKRDKGLVEEWCREIGVGKGVFKVWMHNNKHTFLGSARRGEAGGGSGSGGGVGGGDGGHSGGIEGGGNDSGGHNGHVSSSS